MKGPVPVPPILESKRLLFDEFFVIQPLPDDHVREPERQGPISPWIDRNPLISLGRSHGETRLYLNDFRFRPRPFLSQISIRPMRQHRRPACF